MTTTSTNDNFFRFTDVDFDGFKQIAQKLQERAQIKRSGQIEKANPKKRADIEKFQDNVVALHPLASRTMVPQPSKNLNLTRPRTRRDIASLVGTGMLTGTALGITGGFFVALAGFTKLNPAHRTRAFVTSALSSMVKGVATTAPVTTVLRESAFCSLVAFKLVLIFSCFIRLSGRGH
jgi:hypothetical protein